MGIRSNFSRGKHRHFAYTFQVADNAVKRTFTKLFAPFYTKRNCSILRQ